MPFGHSRAAGRSKLKILFSIIEIKSGIYANFYGTINFFFIKIIIFLLCILTKKNKKVKLKTLGMFKIKKKV